MGRRGTLSLLKVNGKAVFHRCYHALRHVVQRQMAAEYLANDTGRTTAGHIRMNEIAPLHATGNLHYYH